VNDTTGAATTEYVFLVGTVGIVVVVALAAWGPVLVRGYERCRDTLASPFP
jgi:Flp pilus assembly pilin Flp